MPQVYPTCGTQRQLASATVGGKTYSYQYDADGIRTRKTNYDGGYTEYYVVEGLPVAEQRFTATGTKQYILRYLYDESNSPVGFGIYYPTAASPYWQYYYFGKNLQGDVIALYRSDYNSTNKTYTPTLVATYTYDPWGAPTGIYSASGTAISQTASNVAAYNPFRYRGYRYDGDTGFYYMSNRYYDPKIGRFINADDIDFLGADGSPLSYNLFAYCVNNPVNRFDVNGNWSMPNWLKVTVGAVAIAGLAVATVCTGGAAAVICGAALSGAIAGGASGAVVGAIGGGISGGWQGALDGACSGFMSGTLIGGATGAASAGLNIATGATTVVGNAHGSTLHKLATNMEAGKMAASGQYSQIGVNKALKTIGLNGTSRPDVIGIAKNGMNKLVEVVSPRQSTNYIINKMSNMLSNNPGSVGKIVNWVRRLFK